MSRSWWCQTFTHAPSQRRSTMPCRSPAANISLSLTPRTGARARPAAQSHRRVPGGASQSCLPPGEARSLQRHRQLAHTPIHHRIRRAVRRAVVGTRPLGASHPAWWDLKSFPRIGVQMADGLGPLQCHRGRRPRHEARAEPLLRSHRAAWQFATNPFTWEKTGHGPSHGTKKP
jgi:hypothetical protein